MIHRSTIFAAVGLLQFAIGSILGGFWGAPQSALVSAAQSEKRQISPEERLRQLKLKLPPVAKPANTYVPAVRVGDMLYVSGAGPIRPDGKRWVGRLGQNMTVAEGNKAARSVGLRVLGVVKAELGSLDKVVRVVKTLGMVNADPNFKDHPKVINGFSDLMVEVFGKEAGTGARSAVGMSSLPGGIPVEIEVMFQVKR